MGNFPVRTQIYLTKEQYGLLKSRSEILSKSLAEMIREAIDKYLSETDEEDMLNDTDTIWGIVGMAETGLRDLSVNHDKYLYRRSK